MDFFEKIRFFLKCLNIDNKSKDRSPEKPRKGKNRNNQHKIDFQAFYREKRGFSLGRKKKNSLFF